MEHFWRKLRAAGCETALLAVHLGLAAATRNPWMLASFTVSAALLHRWVLREERWRRERFGDEYDAYRAQVPRYL